MTLFRFGRHYNYIFVFVKVMPETVLVPFFLDTVYLSSSVTHSVAHE